MKKISLISLVIGLLFIGKTTFAQDSEYKAFHFGLKVSPALSWFMPDNKKFSNAGSKIGFGYGLMAEFGFSKNYAFSTGLEILNSGGKLNFPTTPDNAYYTKPTETDTFLLSKRIYWLRYVNIPLHLKLKTNQIGSMTYFGEFGFDASILWKARANDDGNFLSQSATTRQDVDIAKDVNFIRLALNVGLGAEYNLSGSTSLVFSVNYNNGFTNALKKNSKDLFLYNSYDSDRKKTLPLIQNAVFNYVGLTVGVLF